MSTEKKSLKDRFNQIKDSFKIPEKKIDVVNEIPQIPHNRDPYKKPSNEVIIKAFYNCLGIISDVAKALNVDRKTIYNWINSDDELRDSLEDVQEHSKDFVEGQLLKRIKGFEHEEIKVFQFMGRPVIVPTIKVYPPDVPAISKWLDAHAKDRGYFSKNLTELSGAITVKNSVENIPEDLLDKELEELESQNE